MIDLVALAFFFSPFVVLIVGIFLIGREERKRPNDLGELGH